MKPDGRMWCESGKNPFKFVVDPDQGTEPGFFFTFFNIAR